MTHEAGPWTPGDEFIKRGNQGMVEMHKNEDLKQNSNRRCPACLSRKVSNKPYYYFWKNRRWVLQRCHCCSHEFVYPLLTQREQAEIYDDFYFSAKGDWACGCFEGGYIDSEVELRIEAKQVLKMIPLHQGKLLEIGCAGGFFLDEARKLGFEVLGVEPNASMANYGKTHLGVDIINSRIENIQKQELQKNFDVIVLMDVLEHIPQPYEAMEKISSILNCKGYVLIRGPLHNDPVARFKEYLRQVIGKEKRLPGYPLDVNCFNKKSLIRLLHEFGIVKLSWINETKGFANLLAQKAAK